MRAALIRSKNAQEKALHRAEKTNKDIRKDIQFETAVSLEFSGLSIYTKYNTGETICARLLKNPK